MNTDLFLVYPLQIVAALAKCALAVALFKTGRWKSFPALSLYAVVEGVLGVALVLGPWVTPTGYSAVWRASRPPFLAVEAAVAVEVYWRLMGKIPNFQRIGYWTCGLFISLSALAAYSLSSSFVGSKPFYVSAAILLTRNFAIGDTAFLIMTAAFAFQFPQRYIAEESRQLTRIALLFFTGEFLTSGTLIASSGDLVVYAISQSLATLIPTWCCLRWIQIAKRSPVGPKAETDQALRMAT